MSEPDTRQPAYTPPPRFGSAPDPEALTVETEPVGQKRNRLPLRWLIALLATVGVVVLVAAIFALSSPEAAPGMVRVAPAGAPFYLELRMDLPGDQRDRLAAFLQHFPGFADQSTMETKIFDTFDQLLLNSTMGTLDWRNDVEPWFGGQVAVFGLPDAGPPENSLVIALSVKDRGAAEALVQQLMTASGGSLEYYRDVAIYSSAFGGGAVGVTDEALLLAVTSQAVRSSIDTTAGEVRSLEDDQDFLAAVEHVRPERLGLLYVSPQGLAPLIEQLAGLFLVAGPGSGVELGFIEGSTFAVELRSEGDHLALTSRPLAEAQASLPPHAVNRASGLVALLPADTLFYAEGREYGGQLREQIRLVLEALEGSGQEQELEQVEAFLGMPLEDFLDFLGDTAVAVVAGTDDYSAGLVARVADEGLAIQRLERVAGALRAAAAIGALPLRVEEEVHGDARVTVIRMTDQQQSGMDLGGLRFDSLSYTVADGLLLFGLDDFVVRALEREPADSLAAQPPFLAAVDAAGGADNAGGFYVDLTGLRLALEATMADDGGQYELEVRPFLSPFTALAGTTVVEDGQPVTRIILLVE